jgi:pseudouridine kinase
MNQGFARPGPVLVVGGANWDLACRSAAALAMGTSNPGTVRRTPGGVGRNIAHVLARLGETPRLLCAVGRDGEGEVLLAACRDEGIDVTLACRMDHPTGLYIAVTGPDGELAVGLSAMAGMEAALDEVAMQGARYAFTAAGAVVVEANLGAAALTAGARFADEAGAPLVVDTVSVPKAARVTAILDAGLPIALLATNRDELAAITGQAVAGERELAAAAARLHERGVARLMVGLGPDGAYVSSDDGAGLVPSLAAEVRDVTGAGDAAVAATLWALRQGASLADAARAGQAAAALTVASGDTVPGAMTAARIRAMMAA